MVKKNNNIRVEAGGLSSDETKEKVKQVNVENEPAELTEEQKQYARMTVKKEFNENFSKWADMPEEEADDEYIEAARKDFNDAIEETKKHTYKIYDADRALAAAKLLCELNAKKFRWKNGEWRGIINFNITINKIIKDLEQNHDKPLELDYYSIIYLYNAMPEPTGMGLEDAIAMAKYENYDYENDKPFEEDIPVTYSGLVEAVGQQIVWLTNNDKKLNILKERVNFALAGIRMNLKITELEEFIEFYNAINDRALENNPDIKKELND